MADKFQSATSGRILRGLAMRQRCNQSGPTTVAHIEGDNNTMADVASRIFNHALSNTLPTPADALLDGCVAASRHDIGGDIDADWDAIADVTLDAEEKTRTWTHWCTYASSCRRDPWLRDTDDAIQQQMLLGFAARVRTGHYGRRKKVNAGRGKKGMPDRPTKTQFKRGQHKTRYTFRLAAPDA
jgi:hypothetical protein